MILSRSSTTRYLNLLTTQVSVHISYPIRPICQPLKPVREDYVPNGLSEGPNQGHDAIKHQDRLPGIRNVAS
jgi:hypothetical protein